MIRYAILLRPGHTPFRNSGSHRIPLVADTILSARKRLRSMGYEIGHVWAHKVDRSPESSIFVELKGHVMREH